MLSQCGYVDSSCWRPPYSRGLEACYTTIEQLQNYQPEIAQKLLEAPPQKKNPIRETIIEPYVYGLWRSGYVRRRWLEIWKIQKWKAIPMEKHKEPIDSPNALFPYL